MAKNRLGEKRLGETVKKFTFRLQTVLEMREKFLEEKQLEMAEVLKMLNDQVERLDALSAKKANTRNSLEAIYEGKEALDILYITGYKNYLSKMINDIRIQEEIIKNTKTILHLKQMEVNAALKEVKVLERLKEKQEQKFYGHIEYVQAKEIDDIATTRYKMQAV